jgi:hypothetical protein
MNNAITVTEQPVYCDQCHQEDTWSRQPQRDIRGKDTGKVYWESWKCACGNQLILEVPIGYQTISCG